MLYPKGCDRVDEIPWFLQAAIDHALTILSWHENLPREEIPPQYLWDDAGGLDLWWKDVREKQRTGQDGGPDRWRPDGDGDDDDDDDERDPRPRDRGGQMAENDLARILKADF